MKKQSLILAAAIAATLSSGIAMADVSANAAATTNYLWRGVTQSADVAAVSGGIDWSDDSGLYAGTWVSGIGGGQEVDYYAGYAGEESGIGYDVGVVTYQYPVAPDFGFTEVYANASVDNFSFGLASTTSAAGGNAGGAFDKGDLYLSVSADFEPVTVFLGSYMFDNDATGNELDYIHYGVSMSKDDFTIALEKNDIDETNQLATAGAGLGNGDANAYRIIVTWSKEWSL